jgi:translocation and assembly module TamA
LALAAAAHAQEAPPPPPPDEPIVPDSQFEKELPPLDPGARQAARADRGFRRPGRRPRSRPRASSSPTPPPRPGARPSRSRRSPSSTSRPPRRRDPADADDDEKVEPVRYTLVVEGLDEIGLEGRFRDLSALEDADGEATNGAMISARAKEDELLAVRLLRSEGYYDATALSSIEQLPDQPGQMRVVVSAVPGPRYNVRRIAIAGRQTEPPNLAREALPLETEDPIVAANVEAAEANVRLGCRSRAIRSPRSAFATSCSIPRPMSATTLCRSSRGRARASPASPPRATSPSARSMSACSPASSAATSTTAARSTICARR